MHVQVAAPACASCAAVAPEAIGKLSIAAATTDTVACSHAPHTERMPFAATTLPPAITAAAAPSATQLHEATCTPPPRTIGARTPAAASASAHSARGDDRSPRKAAPIHEACSGAVEDSSASRPLDTPSAA